MKLNRNFGAALARQRRTRGTSPGYRDMVKDALAEQRGEAIKGEDDPLLAMLKRGVR